MGGVEDNVPDLRSGIEAVPNPLGCVASRPTLSHFSKGFLYLG